MHTQLVNKNYVRLFLIQRLTPMISISHAKNQHQWDSCTYFFILSKHHCLKIVNTSDFCFHVISYKSVIFNSLCLIFKRQSCKRFQLNLLYNRGKHWREHRQLRWFYKHIPQRTVHSNNTFGAEPGIHIHIIVAQTKF